MKHIGRDRIWPKVDVNVDSRSRYSRRRTSTRTVGVSSLSCGWSRIVLEESATSVHSINEVNISRTGDSNARRYGVIVVP